MHRPNVLKIVPVLAVCLALFFSAPVSARTLIAANDPWPPFVDPDAPNQGIATEIVRTALATQGYELQWEVMPWQRAILGVRDANYDLLIGAWYTDERAEYLHYSQPYVDNNVKFIKRIDDPFEYTGLASLNNKHVGTVLGYGYPEEFDQAQNFWHIPAVNLITNIRKLVGNRLDLTLEDEIVARDLISAINPDFLDRIAFTDASLSTNSLHIAVGKAHPEGEAIIAAFNRGLAEIRASGELARILAQVLPD